MTKEEMEDANEKVRLVRQAISNVKPNSGNENPNIDAGAAVAGHLAPELGSDPLTKAEGRFDMRRMGVSTKRLIVAKVWFSWRGSEEGGKNRFWEHLVGEDDNRSPSVEGLGRKQAIYMQGATVGGKARVEEPEKPNWIARNIYNRDWRDDQERKMIEERGY